MPLDFDSAQERFQRARWQGIREDWLARLTGKPEALLPYEAVVSVLETFQHRQLTELRSIPLDKIIGSVERHRDFTRGFLPRNSIAQSRWVRIDMAMNSSVGLPPIEVYQIGDVYFVSDGNHRVSVARANEFKEIDAYVTLIPGIVDIEPGDTLERAIIKAECSHFLAQTRLAEHCDDLDIQITQPGGYPRLLEHIYTHLYFMQLHRSDNKDQPNDPPRYPDAARDWYDHVYKPIIGAVKSNGLLELFPGYNASDLYLWVSARILELAEQHGITVTPEEAAREFAEQAPSPFYRTVRDLVERLANVAGRWVHPDQSVDKNESSPED